MQLSLVVPCYNEEEVLPETARRLCQLLEGMIGNGKVDSSSRVYFVDDGSKDATWGLIETLSAEDPERISGVKLARNQGHQNALLAGLMVAEGDALVSLDADLQDDIRVVEDMVDAHLAGADIVYGVRSARETDTFFKRVTAEGFYKIFRAMGVDAVYNHADFRLLSRRAVEVLREYREVNLFLRGIVPLIGMNTTVVTYDRGRRFAGESKYPLRRMLAFAIEGITSFSAVPLRMITVLGLSVSLLSMLTIFWILAVRFATDRAVPGWASTTLPIYFLGGIQLLGIGIIGEYLAKVYLEVKARPRFVVDRMVGSTVKQGLEPPVVDKAAR